jgi:hypothetical protein
MNISNSKRTLKELVQQFNFWAFDFETADLLKDNTVQTLDKYKKVIDTYTENQFREFMSTWLPKHITTEDYPDTYREMDSEWDHEIDNL